MTSAPRLAFGEVGWTAWEDLDPESQAEASSLIATAGLGVHPRATDAAMTRTGPGCVAAVRICGMPRADDLSGWESCDSCHGAGVHDCDECDGDGDRPCPQLGDPKHGASCRDCGGDGRVDCNPCYGDGTFPCEECDAGYVRIET